MRVVGKWAAALTIACACSGPPPTAPAAVINATPNSVCVGDDFKTQIHLDSRGSAPALTLVYTRPDPDAGDLTYAWFVDGDVCRGLDSDPSPCDVVIDGSSVDALGDMTNPDLLFTMRGDRPVNVTLRVTNAAGGVTESRTTVSITPLDDAGTCPLPQ